MYRHSSNDNLGKATRAQVRIRRFRDKWMAIPRKRLVWRLAPARKGVAACDAALRLRGRSELRK